MTSALRGRKVLVVDDEPDVIETISLVLSDCDLDTAGTYEAARTKLATERYDVAILDIMGVRGYDLLEEFAWAVPCIMLTAHALTSGDLERSMKKRAVLFLPKDEIARLDVYVGALVERLAPVEPIVRRAGEPAPVRESISARLPHAERQGLWDWLFERFDFKKKFGPAWTPPRFVERE